jgi:hypothetical protein
VTEPSVVAAIGGPCQARRVIRSVCVAVLLVSGCGSTHDFEDTEGRHFFWKCRNRGRCDLQDVVTPADATPKPPGPRPGANHAPEFEVVFNANDRFQTVCESWVQRGTDSAGSGSRTETCRIIVCKAKDDCPPEVSSADGLDCINGLCGVPGRALSQGDYMHLCLAGTGAWKDSPEQQARVTLADNASRPSPGAVPAECRQP